MNKKEKLIRHRASLAALLVSTSMLLGGCAKGFDLTVDEGRNFVAVDSSYINNDFIEKCYVVEAKSILTGESNIYIVTKGRSAVYDLWKDVFTNRVLFGEDSSSFEIINKIPLFDYLVSLNLVKGVYSYEDMQRILEEIKSVYKFENDKELVK